MCSKVRRIINSDKKFFKLLLAQMHCRQAADKKDEEKYSSSSIRQMRLEIIFGVFR